MDKTLREYLAEADKLHKEITEENGFLNAEKTKNALSELSDKIHSIQSVSHRIAKIYNACKNKYTYGCSSYKKLTTEEKDPYPEKDDWVKLANEHSLNIRCLVPGIKVNVNVVKTEDDIPNTPLYWIESLGQFGTRINGVLLRGNIGNIQTTPIRSCSKGINCPFLRKGKYCKYYHDIRDVKSVREVTEIPEDTYLMYSKPRNYLNVSWLYTKGLKTQKNKNMRFFGSRNTLKTDIQIESIENKTDWIGLQRDQTFHDLLVSIAVDSISQDFSSAKS